MKNKRYTALFFISLCEDEGLLDEGTFLWIWGKMSVAEQIDYIRFKDEYINKICKTQLKENY